MKSKQELMQMTLKAVRPLKKTSVSVWADNFRQLPSDSAEPGQWRTSRIPYMKEVMDAFTQNGVHRIVVKSAAQVGKALDVNTPIPTPEGWKVMLQLEVGDKVFDERGKICNVVAVSEIFQNHDCYKVTLSDGAEIVADAGHKWYVQEDKRHGTKESILTTEEISRSFKILNGKKHRNRYAIPVTKPLNLSEKDLPVDSYTFGCFLGDGHSYSGQITIHKDDIEIAKRIEANGHKIVIRPKSENFPHILNIQIDPLEIDENICIRGHDMRIVGKTKRGYCAECARQHAMHNKWKGIRDVKVDPIIYTRPTLYGKLIKLNVIHNNHIPQIYLRASYEQRLELLKGILDTDGTISNLGRCEITQKSKILAENIFELLQTLGFKPTLKITKAVCTNSKTRAESTVYRITFLAYSDTPVFHLQRKLARQKKRAGCRVTETERRRIVNVEKIESVPTKCIAVDSPSHLYLAGENFIPTHNSEVLNNVVGRFAHIDPCTIMIVQPTLEQAQDFSRARLSKMINDTKVLTPLFYQKQDTILSKYFIGGRLVLQGANSAAGLASRPIRILLCDEVDRFPQSASGGEGDPVDLAAKRQTTYWNYKTGLFSTPTTEGASRIDIEYLTGTQEEWQHKCPNCGEYHFLDYRLMQVDFKETRDEYGNKTVIVNSVKYQCPDCGLEFDELTMKNAPQKYVVKNGDALKNHTRSFWINGFSSPWLSWNDIMREWLEARGNPQREAVVYNTRFGLSYKLAGEYDDENVFLNRREDYPAELPQGVLLLVCGVDVQANRLEVEIVGFGRQEECWGIFRGIIRGSPNQISTWQELDKILDREYHFANGLSLKVARTFIDSGYATKAVYSYCQMRQNQGRFAIKGLGAMGIPILYKYSQPKGYGIILTIIGSNDAKQEVMSRLGISEVGAQYFHFPRDDEFLGRRGYDSVFFKQLISEHRVVVKSGGNISVRWEPIIPKSRNEALDIRCYALAAMKSCVGNNGDKFWAYQEESLKNDYEVKVNKKKPAPKEKIQGQRQVDIWKN